MVVERLDDRASVSGSSTSYLYDFSKISTTIWFHFLICTLRIIVTLVYRVMMRIKWANMCIFNSVFHTANIQCVMCVCLVCPPLCNPMDFSPWSSSVHGIFQAIMLEWVANSSSRGSSQPRDQTQISSAPCIDRWMLYHCTILEANIIKLLRQVWTSWEINIYYFIINQDSFFL